MKQEPKPLKHQVKDCMKFIEVQNARIRKMILLGNERADNAEKKLAEVQVNVDYWKLEYKFMEGLLQKEKNNSRDIMRIWAKEVIMWQGVILLSIGFNLLVIASIFWKGL